MKTTIGIGPVEVHTLEARKNKPKNKRIFLLDKLENEQTKNSKLFECN